MQSIENYRQLEMPIAPQKNLKGIKERKILNKESAVSLVDGNASTSRWRIIYRKFSC